LAFMPEGAAWPASARSSLSSASCTADLYKVAVFHKTQ